MSHVHMDPHDSMADFDGNGVLCDDSYVAHEEVIEEFSNEDGQFAMMDSNLCGDDSIPVGGLELVCSSQSTSMCDNAVLTSNLPELMSQIKVLPGGASFVVCFSKRCFPQIAYDGRLYDFAGKTAQQNTYLWQCACANCEGIIRTSTNFDSLRPRLVHAPHCQADDHQVRLRIAIYDIRLLAEFTELDLRSLYEAFVDKIRTEQADICHLLPPFELMKPTLIYHRSSLIYRKRFEIRKRAALKKRFEEQNLNSQLTFRRTNCFPPSICMECNLEIISNDVMASHDILIDHILYQHQRAFPIERFTFPDSTYFELWIRELCQRGRYRFIKLGLYDEHMYYLCQDDDRLQRCNHGKTSIINYHCTAFIRVFDWRYILRRELKPVTVEYCLDHYYHNEIPEREGEDIQMDDYYIPDAFMRDMEQRRQSMPQIPKKPASSTQNRSKKQQSQESYGSQPEMKWPTEDIIVTDTENPLPSTSGENVEYYQEETIQNEQRFSPPTVKVVDSISSMDNQFKNFKKRMAQCRSEDVAKRYLHRFSSILDDVMADPACAPRSNRSSNNFPTTEEQTGPDNGPETKQAMFFKREENGQLVVVKRTVRKIAPGESTDKTAPEPEENDESLDVSIPQEDGF